MKNLNLNEQEKQRGWHDFCSINHANQTEVQADTLSAFGRSAVSVTLEECPANNALITRLSRANHALFPLSRCVNTLIRIGDYVVGGRARRGAGMEVVAMMRQKCMMWKYAAMVVLMLTIGVGEMWADTYQLRYMKNMPEKNWDGDTYVTMTQSSANSNRYYCEVDLDASTSYGFFIKKNDSEIHKSNVTANANEKVQLYVYNQDNANRVTFTSSSAGKYIFTYSIDTKEIYVSPKSSEIIKISYATANDPNDNRYDLGNYTDLTQDGSTANYYVDLDLTAVKYYMFVQISSTKYWRGTSTLTVEGSVPLYHYSNDNYGNSPDKINFTPPAAGTYRFTWNHLDKTIKYNRVFSVTFNGNGSSSGSMSAQTILSGTATALTSNTYSKTDYTFAGWNTAADGTGTAYTDAQEVTLDAATGSDLVLYAQWEQTVTLHDNNGGSNNGSAIARYNNAGPFTPTAPTKTGYHIESADGYYAEVGCTNKVMTTAGALVNYSGYVSSGKWVHEGATTLYAKWTVNSYTIAFDANNANYVGTATGSTASIAATYDVNYSLTSNGFTRAGYTFAGWTQNANGSGTQYTDGQTDVRNLTATNGETVTLYAKWTPVTYTLSLNANTSGATGGSATVDYGATSLTIGTTPTRAGYYVEGYYADGALTSKVADADGTLVSSLSGYITDGQWTNTVSPTLYVKWEANTTIYFVNKDGYTTPYATVQTSDGSSTYKTGGEAMTDAGYDFTSYDVYTYNFPATYTKIGFADGTSALTSAFEASTPYYYDGSWYSSLSAIPLYYVRHPKNVLGSTEWATPGTEYMHWKEGHLFYRTYSSLPAANDVEWVLYNNTGGGSYAEGNNIFNVKAGKYTDTNPTQAWPANDTSELKIFLGASSNNTEERFRVNILTACDLTIWYDAQNKKTWTTIVESGDPNFYYHGTDNTWGTGQSMTLSTDGMYYYYNHTTADNSHQFKISTLSTSTNYPALGAAFVTSGFNSTDVTNWSLPASALQSDGNAICTQSGSYYILLYVPGTAVNTSTQYIICASTTLPDNTPAVNPTYSVTYNAGFGGTVTVTYDGTNTAEARYGSPTVQNMSGTPRRIVATPSTGFSFAGWTTSGGAVISNTASAGARTYATGTGTVTANFTTEGKIFVDLSNITTTYKDAANLYAYFYKGQYWDNANGSGSNTSSPYYLSGPHQMTKITGTNIWYFDYAAAGISPTGYVCFCTHNGNVGNFSSCSATYRGDFNSCTPLFVVHNSSATKNGSAAYYNAGYWRTFDNSNPEPGYYLHLYKYNSASDGYSEVEGSPVELVKDNTLDGSIYKAITPLVNADATGYKFKIASCGDVYYGNNGTYDAKDYTSISNGWWDFYDDKNNCGLNVLVDGYDTVFMKFDAGTMKVSVHQPIATNSYRLLYTDGTQTDGLPSYVFDKRAGQENDVSFFIRPGRTPVLKVQKVSAFTASAITWTDVTANILNSAALSKIDKDSIYTIHLTQDASGNINALTSDDVSYYTGNYYIRTDAADGGWGTYMTSPDNLMTYNPASLQYNASNPYDYYFVKWSGANKNVRFVVANDYSPCISDTLITDASGAMSGRENLLETAGANVRYMWNSKTNAVSRAYLSGSTVASDRFLVLTETAADNSGTPVYRIFDKNGDALSVSGLSAHEALFSDNGNWVYQVDLRVRKGAKATITAKYGGYQPDFVPLTILLGETSDVTDFTNEESKTKYSMRMVYDFKTNQFTSSWLIPASGISEALALNTDMMIIRNGQNPAEQLKFSGSGSQLTKVDTIYGVMQFDYNRYVGDGSNLSRVTGNSAWTATDYALNMFYFSFPFDVKMSDIFGIDGYDTYWDIQKYNGAKRAEKGFFRGDGTTTFWETLPMDSTLHAYEGYSLRLSRRDFYDSSKPMWTNKSAGSSIYLYFPSAYSLSDSTISSTSKTINVPAHTCTINREFWVDTNGNGVQDEGEMLNHQNTDSHWNMVGTPVFENLTASSIGNAPKQTDGSTEFKYYYSWNSSSNEWDTEDANTVTFNAMGAFLVQYAGSITFNGASIQPASVAARQRAENRNYTITLQLQKGTEQASKTFVELRENANDSFELNEDMYMAGTSKTATVYTYAGNYDCGANVLSVANHTIPVGVNVKQAGTYNFAMPSDFSGTVRLHDKELNTLTDLSLGDYTVDLSTGAINNRFELVIDIMNVTTSIENNEVGGGTENVLRDGKAHKFLRNGQLYILRDGQVFDARGNKVK